MEKIDDGKLGKEMERTKVLLEIFDGGRYVIVFVMSLVICNIRISSTSFFSPPLNLIILILRKTFFLLT